MTLIELLLEKNGKSPKGRTGEWKGRRRWFPDQADFDAVGKSEFIAQAMELEDEGLLEVKWYDGRGGDIVFVRYFADTLPRLYEMAGQEAPRKELDRYRERVLESMKHIEKDWLKDYYEEMLESLDKGRVVANLEKEGFLTCLEALSQLREPVFKRIFSSHYLKNSKHFEKTLQKPLVRIAKKHCPNVMDAMNDTQVLEQLLIEEYAQQLYVKGGLRLMLEGKELDLSDYPYGISLNSQTLKRAVPSGNQTIRKIVTIENQANFESAPYEEGTLYIFSHGYFSPRECEFLRKLAEVLQDTDCQYFHTGDLDYGGVCIFRDIRTKIFPALQPLQMEAERLYAYKEKGYGEPIRIETIRKLEHVQEPALMDLVQALLDTRWSVEQECFLI